MFECKECETCEWKGWPLKKGGHNFMREEEYSNGMKRYVVNGKVQMVDYYWRFDDGIDVEFEYERYCVTPKGRIKLLRGKGTFPYSHEKEKPKEISFHEIESEEIKKLLLGENIGEPSQVKEIIERPGVVYRRYMFREGKEIYVFKTTENEHKCWEKIDGKITEIIYPTSNIEIPDEVAYRVFQSANFPENFDYHEALDGVFGAPFYKIFAIPEKTEINDEKLLEKIKQIEKEQIETAKKVVSDMFIYSEGEIDHEWILPKENAEYSAGDFHFKFDGKEWIFSKIRKKTICGRNYYNGAVLERIKMPTSPEKIEDKFVRELLENRYKIKLEPLVKV